MSESMWDFYNSNSNSSYPVRQACVAEWEGWLAEVYDAGERQRLERNLKSSQGSEHFSARLELYFHHHFNSQGIRLDFHPELEDRADHPDFLVRHGCGDFYLEATIRHDERSFIEMYAFADLLREELSNIITPHRVYVDIAEPCPGKNLLANIREFLEREILSFDEGDEREKEVLWECRGHLLHFELHRELGEGQSLEISSSCGGFSAIRTYLYNTVVNKGRKYGTLDLPLVIAVWGLSSPPQAEEESALYGTLAVVWNRDHLGNAVGPIREVRRRDGVFSIMEEGQSKNRKVSAVVFYQHRLGDYEHQHLLRVYHNRDALNPLPQDIFGNYPQRVLREVDGHIELHWLNEPADES